MRQSAAGAFGAGLAYSDASSIPADRGRPVGGDVAVPRAQSPYRGLVRNRNFPLLWVGHLVSLLGDRTHIIALGRWLQPAAASSSLD